MTDFNYKKYSLENLENWLHDALSCGDASPHEIYSVIRKVVQDEYDYHKEKSQQCFGLLELLGGHRPVSFDEVIQEREYYEGSMTEEELSKYKAPLTCDKDDSSPECKKSWNNFWHQSSYVSEDGDLFALKKDKVLKWQLPVEIHPSGEYYVIFPDDLLKVAKLKEGDTVEWVDQGDGSYLLRKVTQPLKSDEC